MTRSEVRVPHRPPVITSYISLSYFRNNDGIQVQKILVPHITICFMSTVPNRRAIADCPRLHASDRDPSICERCVVSVFAGQSTAFPVAT